MTIKKIFIYLILTVILLTVISGCNSIDTVQELKKEPGIMDASINYDKTSVNVGVILDNDFDITDKIDLGEKYSEIVKKKYGNNDINVKIIKNKEEISSYSIKQSK
jgi:uncharacterized protein YceK